ncbi:MAG: gliding motility-associated-like protein [Sphingobacteriales bacterium]|jgi:gliding motility-associated-like protein
MKKILCFGLSIFWTGLVLGQVSNDRPETAETLCTGIEVSGDNFGATPDLNVCHESNNSVFYAFRMVKDGGNVYANLAVTNCSKGFGYDQDMSLVILDPDNGNAPVSDCAFGDAEFFATGYNLEGDKKYLLMVDGDKNGPNVTEAAQCSFIIRITGPGVGISTSPDQNLVLGETTQIFAYGGDNYHWEPEEYVSDPFISDPVAFPTVTTTFKVTSTSDNGCEIVAYLNIYITEPISPVNTITPNGDGINDVWKHPALSEYFPLCEVKIYSRWGVEIFSSLGYNTPWDGTYKGKEVPVGTYFFVIDLKNQNGKEIIYTGEISVIR